MKKIMISLFVFVFLVSLSNAWSDNSIGTPNCYQESANVSTSCGGLSTGLYYTVVRSGSMTNVNNMYDRDYSTFGSHGLSNSDLIINYTIPTGTNNGTILRLKAQSDTNYSLNSYLNQNTLSIKITADSNSFTSNLSCYKNGWIVLDSGDWDKFNAVYEDSVYWNISNTIENLTFTQSLVYNNIPATPTLDTSVGYARGMKIIMNRNTYILKVNRVADDDSTRLWIYNGSNSLLGFYDNSSDVWNVNLNVSAGQTYKLVSNKTTVASNHKYITGASYPQASTDFNWTGGLYNNLVDDATTYNSFSSIVTDLDPNSLFITRYLSVPQNTYLINAYMNLSSPPQKTNITANPTGNYTINSTTYLNTSGTVETYWCNAIGDCTLRTFTYNIPITCIINNNLSIIMNNTATGSTYCYNQTGGYILINEKKFDIYQGLTVFFNKHYPTNINVSINNNPIYNYLSSFGQTNNRTNNFVLMVNNYLGTCTYSNGYCQVPIQFHSDTAGLLQYSDLQFSNIGFIENSQTYNSSTLETKNESFALNISYDGNFYSSPVGSLVYNGTSYPATVVTNSNGAIFTKSINIPLGNTTNSFYWTFSLTNSSGVNYFNSTNNTQGVALLNMSFCGSPYTVRFLNFTFHNETLGQEVIKSTFDANFIYSLSGDFTVNKTYSYSNAVEQTNYSFCFTPATSSIYVSASGTYDNAVSQQRSFANSSMLLTNATTVKDLLLLPNSNGIYITFIVTNTYGQKIEGALIDVKKTSGLVPVEQKYTDGTGAAAFWLDTSTSYTITTSASGYITESTGITPSSSPVTILLTGEGTSGGGVSNDKVLDINIKIAPNGNQLANNTLYNFTYNISTQRTLQDYGFALWNSTTRLTSYLTGNEDNGEMLITSFNTENQSYIIMKYYYKIGGNITNGTKVWYAVNDDGTDFSIANALGNLDSTLNSSTGLFGVKKGTANGDFTLAILIFLVILVGAGSMTYKYGITSITAVMFFIFAIVLFIDVGAGIMPNPLGATIPHFLTWLVGIITLYLFIKEGTS